MLVATLAVSAAAVVAEQTLSAQQVLAVLAAQVVQEQRVLFLVRP